MAKVHFRSYNDNKMVLFSQRIDKDTSEDSPVRLLNRQKTERKTKLLYIEGGVPRSLFLILHLLIDSIESVDPKNKLNCYNLKNG